MIRDAVQDFMAQLAERLADSVASVLERVVGLGEVSWDPGHLPGVRDVESA